jgi:hypothetical protein
VFVWSPFSLPSFFFFSGGRSFFLIPQASNQKI